jgi:hypothetical protein
MRMFRTWHGVPYLGRRRLAREWPRVEAGSNTSTVTLRVVGCDEKGSLKFETLKYGQRLHWQGPAAHTNGRPVLSSERAPHKNKTVTVKGNKYRSWAPDGVGHQDLLTDWPSVAMWLELVWLGELDTEELDNFYCNKMMQDEMVSSFSAHGTKRDECRSLMGKPKQRRTLERSRCRIAL